MNLGEPCLVDPWAIIGALGLGWGEVGWGMRTKYENRLVISLLHAIYETLFLFLFKTHHCVLGWVAKN